MDSVRSFLVGALMLVGWPVLLVMLVHYGLKMLPGVGTIYKWLSAPVTKKLKALRKLLWKKLKGWLREGTLWVGRHLWRGVRAAWVRITS